MKKHLGTAANRPQPNLDLDRLVVTLIRTLAQIQSLLHLRRFLCDGPDSQRERDARFKLIPSVIHASWIIKQAVGTTPVLLGNKLVTRYFRRGHSLAPVTSLYCTCRLLPSCPNPWQDMVFFTTPRWCYLQRLEQQCCRLCCRSTLLPCHQ